MLFNINHPGLWKDFYKKPENKNLTIVEATKKYKKQLLLFENQYTSFLQYQHMIQLQHRSGGGIKKKIKKIKTENSMLTEDGRIVLTEDGKILDYN